MSAQQSAVPETSPTVRASTPDAAIAERPVHGHDHEHDHDEEEHGVGLTDVALAGVVALAALASWLELWQHFASFDVIALVATLLGGIPIFKEAFEALLKRRMTMELSMT